MNIHEVRAMAKRMGIRTGRLKKEGLIRAIQQEEGNFDCFASATDGICDREDCIWLEECLSRIGVTDGTRRLGKQGTTSMENIEVEAMSPACPSGNKVRRVEAGRRPTALHGYETVLLADDDPMVRNFEKTVLETFGYRVIEAWDGADAVEKFKANSSAVKLVILDVMMPRMTGKQAHVEILNMRPGTKILFITGNPGCLWENGDRAIGKVHLLLKPISPNELLQKTRDILDERTGEPCGVN
jgi:CheY-like chemotaxis protein